jgi:type VI protein secretion system component VasF
MKMKTRTPVLVIAGIAIAAVAVWYFFLREKDTE